MKVCDCEAVLYNDGSLVIRPPVYARPIRYKTWSRDSLNGHVRFQYITLDGVVRAQFVSTKTGQVFDYVIIRGA